VRFPALRLAREALKSGGGAPTILNAANEVAVAAFLAGEIGFLDIVRSVEETLSVLPAVALSSLDDLRRLDAEARELARQVMRERRSISNRRAVNERKAI